VGRVCRLYDSSMKAYTVGQKIRLRSGDKFREATVIEVTTHYTNVEPADPEPLLGNWKRYCIQFNNRTGKQAGIFIYLGKTSGWVEEDRRPLCGDGGKGEPWEIIE
jgi:hypothetical protein